jgi:hypothetical protein
MDIYSENDYLIWVDLDSINFMEPLRLHKLMDTMQRRIADVAYAMLPYNETHWTKEDMLVAFNATEVIRSSFQINGAFHVVRISDKMRRYYDAMIDCNSDFHMISDEPSILPNRDVFVENRHDQSIQSLFYKTYLSNQSLVGPPAQPSVRGSHLYTFNLDERIDVSCPFKEFYRYLPSLQS